MVIQIIRLRHIIFTGCGSRRRIRIIFHIIRKRPSTICNRCKNGHYNGNSSVRSRRFEPISTSRYFIVFELNLFSIDVLLESFYLILNNCRSLKLKILASYLVQQQSTLRLPTSTIKIQSLLEILITLRLEKV